MKKGKLVIISLLIAILLSSGVIGIAESFMAGQSGVSGADYVTLEGVASSDYYSLDSSRQYCYFLNQWAYEEEIIGSDDQTLYPPPNPAYTWFKAGKSLRVGMTEFGEFATPANTGIAYGGSATEWRNTESWASIGINPSLYIQGWVFYLDYMRAGLHRAIEGYALFSDLNTTEGGRKVYSWWGDYQPGSTASQLTLGSLSTTGVQVLYDSARLVVARSSTIIHDGYYNEDVAKVTITVVFNKDTKYAIVYKDVKILLDTKVLDLIRDFAFSERYEIDVARGVNPSNRAYIHYYQDWNQTVYQHPLTGQDSYDVLQAFDSAQQYLFYAAYWPTTTQYSVYYPLVPNLPIGFTRVLPFDHHIADTPAEGGGEPNTPWVVAQWRYQQMNPEIEGYAPKLLSFLAKEPQREIRFVEVFGMTDYNFGTSLYSPFRAKDANATALGMSKNFIDVEVQFSLDYKVFNPEDLTDATDDAPMWMGLGQSAATTDSAGGSAMSDFAQYAQLEPLGLFDRNDTAFPWTAPVVGMKGSIPFALDNDGDFAPNYLESFSNLGKGKGNDGTIYTRTGLNGFVYNYYDATNNSRSPPQPIAGGMSAGNNYWYPSKDPLTERWANDAGSFTPAPYDIKDSEGIVTIGGVKANGITRYFNDFNFAIMREGPNDYALVDAGTTSGTAPTSNPSIVSHDFFPISTWNSGAATFNYKEGYAVISIAEDINGTKGISVHGWDGRDTYWASAWASQYIGTFSSWIRPGTVALILQVIYNQSNEPYAFTVVKALGTITELGSNMFITNHFTFDIALSADPWNGAFAALIPSVPGSSTYGEWWYAKLPTSSIAKVDFDP